MPSVNDTTVREISQESLKFGRASPCILQAIWEEDLVRGTVRASHMDVTYAYHRGTLRTAQVGAFTYIVPAAYEGDCVIFCINLVLPMGWVDSPKYFCTFSETLTDVANALVHTPLPVPAYSAILGIL